MGPTIGATFPTNRLRRGSRASYAAPRSSSVPTTARTGARNPIEKLQNSCIGRRSIHWYAAAPFESIEQCTSIAPASEVSQQSKQRVAPRRAAASAAAERLDSGDEPFQLVWR